MRLLLFVVLSTLAVQNVQAIKINRDGTLTFSYTQGFYQNKPDTLRDTLYDTRVPLSEKKKLISRVLLDINTPKPLNQIVLDGDLHRAQPEVLEHVFRVLYLTADPRLDSLLNRPAVLKMAVRRQATDATDGFHSTDDLNGIWKQIENVAGRSRGDLNFRTPWLFKDPYPEDLKRRLESASPQILEELRADGSLQEFQRKLEFFRPTLDPVRDREIHKRNVEALKTPCPWDTLKPR